MTNLVVGWDEDPAVRGLDLHVQPGQTVLIEGASGAGKSTLAAALAGLLRPTSGTISLDGTALTDQPGAQWRSSVALAGEPDHIFASTLRQNLLLARPGASDVELEQALIAAQLGAWLRGLSQGLDTWLDSGGRVLSGGERRRLVLTRALLRDPAMLILDEPTEGLDAGTAQDMLAGLLTEAAARQRVVVTFSHRQEGLDVVHRRYRLTGGQLLADFVAS